MNNGHSKLIFFFNNGLFLSLFLYANQKTFVMQSATNDLNNMLRSESRGSRPKNKRGIIAFQGLLAGLMMILAVELPAQGWEITFGGDNEDFGQAVIQTVDHGYFIVGFSESYGQDNDLDMLGIRTDVDGTPVWIKEFDEGYVEHAYDVIETQDGGFLLVGDYSAAVNASVHAYLVKISKYGDIEWSRIYNNNGFFEQANAIVEAANGGYAIVGLTKGTANGEDDILLIRLDSEGNELWRQTYGGVGDDRGTTLAALPDGGFIIAGQTRNGSVLYDRILMRINSDGSQAWSVIEGESNEFEEVFDVIITQDNGIITAGSAKSSARAYLGRHSLDGGLVWEKTFSPGPVGGVLNAILEMPDGSLVVTGSVEMTAANADVYVAKFDAANGNEIWSRNLGDPNNFDSGEGIAPTEDGGFVIAGFNSLSTVLINDVTLIKTDALGHIITNHLTGKVYHSLDGCNEFGANDAPLTGWYVKAEGQSNNKIYFGTTDANGDFDILVDTGTYLLTLLPPNSYWDLCNPDGFTVTLDEFYSNSNFNFPVLAGVLCPYLDVAVSTNFLTVCSDVPYTVDYVNLGPAVAQNAYVEVTIDTTELTFVDASLPWTQNGNVYHFSLGDIAFAQHGSITINTEMACSGIAQNQAALVSAHIFPDSFCLQPSPNWDGSSVTVNGECVGDSIRFSIRNAGLAEMTSSLKYFVVEDQVMFLQDTFRLDSDEEEYITFEGNGSTFRLIAEQSEGHPGNNHPTVVIEGCTELGGSYSTGFVGQFPENDADPFLDIDVQETLSSITSPVLLRGYPKGYQDSIITDDTELKYTIFFRNVGTDTINRVVIRDTLPPSLDIATLVPGAGSHPYDFELYTNGVLKITFNEIQLQPGDSAEEALKSGFAQFRIAQKPGNPLGTVIENNAVVYFDYVAPVQTNTVRHVVDCNNLFDVEEGCIVVEVTNPPYVPGVNIRVFPNPFVESATFEIEGRQYNKVALHLYDLQGRLVRSELFQGNRFDFFRHHLPSGVYLFRLDSDGHPISSGKMVIE